MKAPSCTFCDEPGGAVIVQAPQFRVVRADEAGFPAFYRLIWVQHVTEFSDLTAAERRLCIEGVAQVEQVLRAHLQPVKINLASLGNMVPHLHWHIIARFDWDSHFPGPVWGAPRREAPADRLAAVEQLLSAVERDLAAQLGHDPRHHLP